MVYIYHICAVVFAMRQAAGKARRDGEEQWTGKNSVMLKKTNVAVDSAQCAGNVRTSAAIAAIYCAMYKIFK